MAQIKKEIVEMVEKLENERYIKYLWELCKTFLKKIINFARRCPLL